MSAYLPQPIVGRKSTHTFLTWRFLHAGLHCQPQWDKSLQEGPKVTYRKFGVQHNIHWLHPGKIWWCFEQANRRIEAILFKLRFWLGSNRMNEFIRVHTQYSNFEVKLCIGNEEFEECEFQIWIISLLWEWKNGLSMKLPSKLAF